MFALLVALPVAAEQLRPRFLLQVPMVAPKSAGRRMRRTRTSGLAHREFASGSADRPQPDAGAASSAMRVQASGPRSLDTSEPNGHDERTGDGVDRRMLRKVFKCPDGERDNGDAASSEPDKRVIDGLFSRGVSLTPVGGLELGSGGLPRWPIVAAKLRRLLSIGSCWLLRARRSIEVSNWTTSFKLES
mmetsp:Transcript_44172/g.82161  ORF Transcript_44172/g.82161 Transcript_44172/m.82161 type:complete len:189 (+) Transcript_44172:840-1406(+)